MAKGILSKESEDSHRCQIFYIDITPINELRQRNGNISLGFDSSNAPKCSNFSTLHSSFNINRMDYKENILSSMLSQSFTISNIYFLINSASLFPINHLHLLN